MASLTSGLAREGLDVTVFTTDLGRAVSARTHEAVAQDDLVSIEDDVTVRIFKSRRPRRLAFAPDLGRELARQIDEFDVVHVHSLFLYPQAMAAKIARSGHVPYIVSPRGSLDPWVRSQGRFQKAVATYLWQADMLTGAAAIHVAGDGEAAYVADIAPHVPRLVIPNGVDMDEFGDDSLTDRREFRAELGVSDGIVVVLYLGRLSRKKNLGALIDAFATIWSEGADAVLVIAGPDDEELTCELQRQVSLRGVQPVVRILGEIRGRAKRRAFAGCDLFVLPSHTENFGVAAVEALAAGCPVIVSDGVAIASELEASGAVRVVRPMEADLADGLRDLIHDSVKRNRYAAAARAAARRYDWRSLIPRYIDGYRAVVEKAVR